MPTREVGARRADSRLHDAEASYKELLKKKEDSKLAANLERRQIGETFQVIDAASLPQRPFNQMRRLQVVLAAPSAGLVLGLALIGFLEYRDSSFKTEEDVVRVLSLPVLALVPMMVSDKERAADRRRRIVVPASWGSSSSSRPPRRLRSGGCSPNAAQHACTSASTVFASRRSS